MARPEIEGGPSTQTAEKPYRGKSLRQILKVRQRHMAEFITPPFIGSGIVTIDNGEYLYRAITIHLNRQLTDEEAKQESFIDGVPVRYIADGINVPID